MATRKVYTQVSLDLPTIDEALGMAEGAVRAGIDWIEVGTPLLLGEGLHAVEKLRQKFPDHPLVADLKTMDGGGVESEMMFKAGADYTVVMSQAHWASVKEMVTMAKKLGGKVMGDVLNAPNKVDEAKRLEDLGVDWIIVHTGYDERHFVDGLSPLDDLPGVLDAVDIPVQAVGGLSIEQAIESVRMGASSLVIGAPLAIQRDQLVVGDEYEKVLSDIVRQVKEITK